MKNDHIFIRLYATVSSIQITVKSAVSLRASFSPRLTIAMALRLADLSFHFLLKVVVSSVSVFTFIKMSSAAGTKFKNGNAQQSNLFCAVFLDFGG
jgi:hypothetical protein